MEKATASRHVDAGAISSRQVHSMDSPPILDACLIVKDEALNLPRCLASLEALRPLLGEVHVYDTGSTDDTIAIARAAGCHVAEGYWDDDFARARNASLAMSSAAWALTIDADEEYVGDPAALAGHLVGTGCDVFSLVQQHLDEEGRIAGRTPYAKLVWRDEVRFARAIHEIPTRLDGRTCRIGTIGESVASLRHYGYATERLRAAKAERNAGTALGALSAARARRDPTDVIRSARHAARSLAALGRTDDALVLYAEALAGFAVGTLSWRLTAVDITTTLIESGVEPGRTVAEVLAVVVLAVAAGLGVLYARRLGGRWAVAVAMAWGLAWIGWGRLADEPSSTVVGGVALVAAVVVLAAPARVRRDATT